MAHKINSFERFWKELKRRKVFSVVTTYAATAYIIIEVTNNLVEPLSLPSWIAKLVILFLGTGLPVVVILSWIFDFTPQGIKKTESLEELEGKEVVTKPVKSKLRASYFLNAVLIIAVIVLAYPKIFKRDTLERLRSSGERLSVVVMPFQNMTGDTTWNTRQDWIQDILINSLSNQKELKLKPAEDINGTVKNQGIVNYASLSPSVAGVIAKKLDANIFVYGNIKQVGTTIRLYAQLIDPKSENVFKSFQIEGSSREEKIFQLIDSLSTEIKNFLVLSNLLKVATPDDQKYLGSTTYPQAFNYSMEGDVAFTKGDFSTATNLYLQSIAIDSNYLYPYIYLSYSYSNSGNYEEGKKWCLKAYEKRKFMSRAQKAETNTLYGYLFETPSLIIRYLKQALEYDDQLPRCHADLGWSYNIYYQYDKAISEYKKALKIYNKWGVKPFVHYDYTGLGYAYHKTGQYKKEKKVYQRAEKDFPDDDYLCYRQAVLALTQKNVNSANIYVEKYKSMLTENFASEPTIITSLAGIYTEANILDKGEGYLRQAYSLEPENPLRLNNLAYFLIDKDLNINEGLELIDKALALSPDNYDYLHTRGLGLYKQGKYKESLETLQRSWDLRREKAVYDHEAYLHLEAAKKAVAGLK